MFIWPHDIEHREGCACPWWGLAPAVGAGGGSPGRKRPGRDLPPMTVTQRIRQKLLKRRLGIAFFWLGDLKKLLLRFFVTAFFKAYLIADTNISEGT